MLGGGFNHISTLHMMKYKEVISWSMVKHGNKWWRKNTKKNLNIRYRDKLRTIKNQRSKILGLVWSMKKKADRIWEAESTRTQSERWRTLWQLFNSSSCNLWHNDSHYTEIDVDGWLGNTNHWCKGGFHMVNFNKERKFT